MTVTTAQELRERLKREKAVDVGGMTFLVRKVPLLLLADEKDDLWGLARESQSALAEKIKALATSPTIPCLRRILLAGIVQPQVTVDGAGDSVPVDLVLADYPLSTGLFIEIMRFSLEA